MWGQLAFKLFAVDGEDGVSIVMGSYGLVVGSGCALMSGDSGTWNLTLIFLVD